MRILPDKLPLTRLIEKVTKEQYVKFKTKKAAGLDKTVHLWPVEAKNFLAGVEAGDDDELM